MIQAMLITKPKKHNRIEKQHIFSFFNNLRPFTTVRTGPGNPIFFNLMFRLRNN